MNDLRINKKTRRDTSRLRKDISTLAGDNTARLGRFGDDVSYAADKAKEDLTTWVEDGVNQMSEGFEKFSGEAKGTMLDAAAAMKKDVGHGLSQYNDLAQEAADQVPGGFSKQAARYPWVVISVGLVIGFLLGRLLKPTR
jgi:ElaB/YqjD/DUF883 family membrane-anchored ribosome-binding protein